MAKLYHKQMGQNFVKIYFHCTVKEIKWIQRCPQSLDLFINISARIGILSILNSTEMMPSLTTDRALLWGLQNFSDLLHFQLKVGGKMQLSPHYS